MKWCVRCSACLVAAAIFAAGSEGRGKAREQVDADLVMRSSNGSWTILHPPRLERMAREIALLLDRSAPEIADELGLESIAPIRVFIAADDDAYRHLSGGRAPDWSAAWSGLTDRVIGIHASRASRGPRSLRAVVRHELSHLLLAERVGDVSLPVWFMEGLAMMQAGEWRFADEWNFMLLVGRGRLPYLEEISGPFPRRAEEAALAYALSYRAVSGLFAEAPGSLPTLTAFIRDRGDFEDAFFLTYGMTPYDYASRLYVSVHERYEKPGAILNASPYWLAASLLVVAAFFARRARTKRRLREMEARDAAPSSFSS